MQDKRKVWTLDQRLDRTTVNVPPSSWDYLIIRHKGKQAGLAARGAHCPLVIGMQDAFEISTNWRRGKVVSPAPRGARDIHGTTTRDYLLVGLCPE